MKTAPIFDFDDRYFLESEYTIEELFQLQEKVLELKNSTDLKMDLNMITDFNDKEIDLCLRESYRKGVIKREKIKALHYRYFY